MGNRDKVKTAEDITAAIRARIEHGENVLHFAGVVREVARKMEGRKVDKRFGTAVAARVAEALGAAWVVHWASDSWGAKVEAWQYGQAPGQTIAHSARLSFNVARWRNFATKDNQAEVSEAWIVAQNECYFLEAERLPIIRKALEDDKPRAWAAQIAEIDAMRKALGADAGAAGLSYLLDY